MKSELSFFKIGCLTKAKEPSLAYNLLIDGGRTDGFMPFPNSISTKWNANSLVQDLNLDCPFPITLFIMKNMPP